MTMGRDGGGARASPAEVTELQHGCLGVQQQVLGLDVTVTDPEGVDVGQAAEELVHVQLHTRTHTHRHTHRKRV